MPDQPMFPLSTAEQRRQALAEWAEQNPFSTIAAASDYLRSRFGQAIDTKTMASIMRNARDVAQQRLMAMQNTDTPPPPPTEAPKAETGTGGYAVVELIMGMINRLPPFQLVSVAIRMLRMAGVTQVTIVDGNTASVDGTTVLA